MVDNKGIFRHLPRISEVPGESREASIVLNPLNHTKSNDQTQEAGFEGESGGDLFKP